MKRLSALVLAGLLAGLIGVLPAAAASASISIYNTAVCKDEATVVLTGSSTYTNNRVEAYLYYKTDKGEDVLLAQSASTAFGAGPFMLALTLPYTAYAQENEVLRLDVKLRKLSTDGKVYETVSKTSQNVTVADKYCHGKCSVTVDTIDKTPASGTLTLRSHFGEWFRPEGRLQGALPVAAGQKVRAVFVGVTCNWPVRAWYYPRSGDKTPLMLPAQYWPNEFQANLLDGTNPYTTAFAKSLKSTRPLESDDPFVTK